MYDNEFWKIGLMFLLILAVTLAFVGAPIYIGSCYEAKIYNQKNNTNYTCSDFFFEQVTK